jgi:hypothetical protein
MGLVGLGAKRILMPSDPSLAQIQNISSLASRLSIASILLLFLAGGILFYFVDEDKGQKEVLYLSST